MPAPPGTIRRGKRLLDSTTRRVLPPAVTDSPPEEDPDTIMIPGSILGNEQALAYWDYIIADAKRNDRFSPSYAFLYTQCSLTAVQLEKEWIALQKEETIVDVLNRKGDKIGERENPRIGVIAKLQRSMTGFIAQLGLSPRAVQFLFVQSNNSPTSSVPAIEAQVTPVKPKNGQIELFR